MSETDERCDASGCGDDGTHTTSAEYTLKGLLMTGRCGVSICMFSDGLCAGYYPVDICRTYKPVGSIAMTPWKLQL